MGGLVDVVHFLRFLATCIPYAELIESGIFQLAALYRLDSV